VNQAGRGKDLVRQWDNLWVYLHRDGTVPSNSEAERSVRKAVLWRKVHLGGGSEDGAHGVDRMLTLAGTPADAALISWMGSPRPYTPKGLEHRRLPFGSFEL